MAHSTKRLARSSSVQGRHSKLVLELARSKLVLGLARSKLVLGLVHSKLVPAHKLARKLVHNSSWRTNERTDLGGLEHMLAHKREHTLARSRDDDGRMPMPV